MTANKQMKEHLNHSLKYAVFARSPWYHKPKPRDMGINWDVLQAVQKTGHKRPTYVIRRMAAQLSGGTGAFCKLQADAANMSKNEQRSCLEKENMTL